MLTHRERRRIVYEHLELIAVEYRLESDKISCLETSAGLVCRYGSTGGGGSGKITDIPATLAILSASEKITTKNARAWRVLTASVYEYLLRPNAKTEFAAAHDQLLAWLLFHRVLLGQKLSDIASSEIYGEGHVPAENLSRYFSEIIDLCVAQAIKRRLIP